MIYPFCFGLLVAFIFEVVCCVSVLCGHWYLQLHLSILIEILLQGKATQSCTCICKNKLTFDSRLEIPISSTTQIRQMKETVTWRAYQADLHNLKKIQFQVWLGICFWRTKTCHFKCITFSSTWRLVFAGKTVTLFPNADAGTSALALATPLELGSRSYCTMLVQGIGIFFYAHSTCSILQSLLHSAI